MTIRSLVRALVYSGLVCVSAGLSACGDNPFELNWSANADTALIFSLARPELNLPSGFNFALRRTVEIQRPNATGDWDVVLDTEGAQLVMRVPSFYGISSDSRIAVFENKSFDEVLKAPNDSLLFIANEAVPMSLGNTYVIQTHRDVDQFGQSCHFFAKFTPLVLNVAQGTMQFVYDRNPLCEDLDLVPPPTGN